MGEATAETDRSWSVRGIHHVAFAHRDAAVLSGLESLLGLRCTHEEDGPGFHERIYDTGAGGRVQTLEATGEGVVEDFLVRRGAALHHLAFEVDDIDEALGDLQRRGARLIDELPRRGGEGTRIAFVHPQAFGGLLVELVEGSGAECNETEPTMTS
ncbi:MAG: methylmalonyl-CoA epimerase [Acidimicrobiaceae bacterium]|nr:methylmalonyl-CoA epimerase [Acidimicrobiaceae bacterium]